jgi:hypothetical protein
VGFFIAKKTLEVKKKMRKLILLFLAFLLAGCSLSATPTPTPIPTATPTPAARYYPTADPQTAQLLRSLPEPSDYYVELSPPGSQKVFKAFTLMVISSGETATMSAGDFVLDVLWVYERNRTVAYYPLVVGVQEGDTYTPYYMGYAGTAGRQEYLEFLQNNDILARGRKIFPFVEGDYVSRAGIDWQECGEDVVCRLGRHMQETYALDHQMQLGIVGVSPIPEGWVLAFLWDAATATNTLPGEEKITLP